MRRIFTFPEGTFISPPRDTRPESNHIIQPPGEEKLVADSEGWYDLEDVVTPAAGISCHPAYSHTWSLCWRAAGYLHRPYDLGLVRAPTGSETGDLVLRFRGHSTGLLLRCGYEIGCVLIGTTSVPAFSIDLESTPYIKERLSGLRPGQEIYLCLNFALLQRLTRKIVDLSFW